MNFETDAQASLKEALAGFATEPGRFWVRIDGQFHAAQYLYGYFPDGRDEPLHGHTYRVEVFLSRLDEGLDGKGLSVDFLGPRARLDQLLERIDHVCINDLEEFKGVNPTAENIARWFFRGLRDAIQAAAGRVQEVRVFEGPDNVAIFRPDRG